MDLLNTEQRSIYRNSRWMWQMCLSWQRGIFSHSSTPVSFWWFHLFVSFLCNLRLSLIENSAWQCFVCMPLFFPPSMQLADKIPGNCGYWERGEVNTDRVARIRNAGNPCEDPSVPTLQRELRDAEILPDLLLKPRTYGSQESNPHVDTWSPALACVAAASSPRWGSTC